MNPSEKYINWLRSKISALSSHIIYSFVFGSVARHSPSPNDCDLMVLTSSSPQTKEWNSVRKQIDRLCKLFNAEFDLNLSAILLTIDEYTEKIPFLKRILSRPLIELYGHGIETPNNLFQRRAKSRAR